MTHRTRVKICGITRLQDALLSARLGADALGFVFVEASKRNIHPRKASALCASVPPFITRVGLFLDASQAEVETALEFMPQMLLQFHGQETPAECERYGRPYIKALGLGANMPSAAMLGEYENAEAFLLDSNEPGQLGGTGHAFDWSGLESDTGWPLVLAGGLNPDNVAAAISTVQPYAVDVSTGVEDGVKGIKHAPAISAFMLAVQQADAAHRADDGNNSRNQSEITS